MPSFPINLGGLESEDPRNVPLGAAQAPAPYPAKLTPDVSAIPTYYQDGQPACGGHAFAWFKSYLDFLNLQLAVARSPRFTYAIAKTLDGIPNVEGTTGEALFKSGKYFGTPDLSLYPNDIHRPKQQYADASQIPNPAKENAVQNRTGTYAVVYNPSLERTKQVITQNQAAILLIYCDDGFFGTNTPAFTQKKYGHFVVAYGYDENGVYIVDSTEPTSAYSYKYIPATAFAAGFIREAWTAVDIPNWKLKGITSKIDLIRYLTTSIAFAQMRLTALLKGR